MHLEVSQLPDWLANFCSWLAVTPFSLLMQNVEWLVPMVQIVHILAIAAVISSVFVVNLRLIGIFGNDQSHTHGNARFLTVIWWTLPILLATGAVLIIAEPARSLASSAFQLKMVLLVLAIIVTLYCQNTFVRDSARLGRRGGRNAARLIAVLSLTLWIGIIFAGRWIAYAPGK
jgi:hypothetical protein